MSLPANLQSLHSVEEQLHGVSVRLIEQYEDFRLHIASVECAMDLCDVLRQFPTDDEDLKVIQILGMRMFNAFGSSLKLALSGYAQNSVLIMRDVIETIFLVELFGGDRALIAKWRLADAKLLKRDFSPAAVRKVLDDRYGNTTRKREELYKMFSELAGHPTMKSIWMMQPQKDGIALSGPFMTKDTLEAVLSEMGRLAIQVGQNLPMFFPPDWKPSLGPRLAFIAVCKRWLATFYPNAGDPAPPSAPRTS